MGLEAQRKKKRINKERKDNTYKQTQARGQKKVFSFGQQKKVLFVSKYTKQGILALMEAQSNWRLSVYDYAHHTQHTHWAYPRQEARSFLLFAQVKTSQNKK